MIARGKCEGNYKNKRGRQARAAGYTDDVSKEDSKAFSLREGTRGKKYGKERENGGKRYTK